MPLNPGIILSGSNPNLVNSFARGQVAGAQQKQFQSKNKLREFLTANGPDVLAGDQNALNELSRFDPQASLGIQDSKLQIKQREQAMQNAKEAGARAARAEARTLSAAQRAEEVAKIDKALAMATQAQTTEQWDALMSQLQLSDFVGKFEQRDMIFAGALGIKEGLELNAPPKPQSPSGKLQADIDAGLVPVGTTEGGGKQEEQIARLMEGGLDRNTAIGITDGRFVVSIDQLGAATIIDKATGDIVRPSEGDSTTEQADPSQPLNVPQEPPTGGGFGDNTARDFTGATGIVGLVSSLANNLASAAGAPLPAAEINNAQNTMKSLNRQTTVLLAGELGGRPSNLSLELIRTTLPEVAAIFSGPEDTLSRARETRRVIGQSIGETAIVADGTGQFTAKQVSDARKRLLGLQNIAQQWDAIVSALTTSSTQPTQSGGVTPNGISFEIIQ